MRVWRWHCRSIREGEKAAMKKKRSVVTAGLRGDDYLPAEVLDHLPTATATTEPAEVPAKAKPSRAEARAAAKRKEPREQESRDGLPRTIQKSSTVEVAVLPDDSSVRLHAPVSSDVRNFMQKQLYGDRHRRAPAATIASLRPSGGRFGAASNFATATASALQPESKGGRKKRKSAGADTTKVAGSYSTLERMAARIMQKNKR